MKKTDAKKRVLRTISISPMCCKKDHFMFVIIYHPIHRLLMK